VNTRALLANLSARSGGGKTGQSLEKSIVSSRAIHIFA
jgi:hypothetical protein